MSSDPRGGDRRRRPRFPAEAVFAGRPDVADLEALSTDAVTTALALVRGAPLGVDDISSATEALAEISDALALVSDHLARQLHTVAHDRGDAVEGLHAVRDLLTGASSRARRVTHSSRGDPDREPGPAP